jgi:Flp pilus assembly protein TadD
MMRQIFDRFHEIFIGCTAALLAVLYLSACHYFEARISADKGYRSYLNKKFVEAITNYDHANKLFPSNSKIRRNLGYAHLGAAKESTEKAEIDRHYRLAIEHLGKVLAEEPDDKELAGVMLDAWTQAGRLEDAARFYQDRVASSPKNMETLRLLGMIEVRRGNYQAALDTYETRHKLRPNDMQLYASKAILCWEWLRSGSLSDPAQALRVASLGLDAALEVDRKDPKHPSALIYAGLLLRERAKRQVNQDEAQKDLLAAQRYLEKLRSRKVPAELNNKNSVKSTSVYQLKELGKEANV